MTEMAATQKDVVRINQGALSDHRLTLKTIPAESSGETTEIAIPNGNERFLSEFRKLPKVELVHQDASRYVAETQGKFDVVILDFPDPSSPGLAKLYGLSFYGQLHGILRENGPLHANVPSFGDWGWWLATPDSQRSPADLKQALADIQSFDIPTRYLTRDTLLAATVFSPQSLETSFNDITTLDDPAIFRHYLNAWKSPN